MTGTLRKFAMLAAVAALPLVLAGPSQAAQKAQVLPGVKGYNFNATPGKLRRLCKTRWGGRYWRVGAYYGCDNVKREGWFYRIKCLVSRAHSKEFRCVLTQVESPRDNDTPLTHRDPHNNGNAGHP